MRGSLHAQPLARLEPSLLCVTPITPYRVISQPRACIVCAHLWDAAGNPALFPARFQENNSPTLPTLLPRIQVFVQLLRIAPVLDIPHTE